MATLRFQFRPSGPTCRHVRVTAEDGTLLRTYVEADLARLPRGEDDHLAVQVKRAVQDAGGLAIGIAALKTTLESKDWSV